MISGLTSWQTVTKASTTLNNNPVLTYKRVADTRTSVHVQCNTPAPEPVTFKILAPTLIEPATAAQTGQFVQSQAAIYA